MKRFQMLMVACVVLLLFAFIFGTAATGQESEGEVEDSRDAPADATASGGAAPTVTAVPPTAPTSSSSTMPAAAAFGFIGVFFMMYFVIICFAMVFGLGNVAVKLLAIYDCARRDFDDPNTRALWCIVLALVGWIGALVYYIIIYRKNDPPLQMKQPAAAQPAVEGEA